MKPITAFGFIGGLILSFSSLPQLIYTYTHKDARSISWGMLCTLEIGLILNATYGMITNQPSIYVTACMSASINGTIAILKYRYQYENLPYSSVELDKIKDIEIG